MLHDYNIVAVAKRICLTLSAELSSLQREGNGLRDGVAVGFSAVSLKVRRAVLIGGVVASGIVGCGTVDTASTAAAAASKAPVEAVRKRALERWQFALKGDSARAYEFLSPASRSTITLTSYMQRLQRGGTYWRGADVEAVECGPESCNVTVALTYDLKDVAKGLKRTVKEVWLLDEGQWWLADNQR